MKASASRMIWLTVERFIGFSMADQATIDAAACRIKPPKRDRGLRGIHRAHTKGLTFRRPGRRHI
jgi:hypothetical protein